MNVIKTNNLTKFYGKYKGIENINLEINKGEIFGFIGPNGAGKSTTIRLLPYSNSEVLAFNFSLGTQKFGYPIVMKINEQGPMSPGTVKKNPHYYYYKESEFEGIVLYSVNIKNVELFFSLKPEETPYYVKIYEEVSYTRPVLYSWD